MRWVVVVGMLVLVLLCRLSCHVLTNKELLLAM